jgi:hypothetical protein
VCMGVCLGGNVGIDSPRARLPLMEEEVEVEVEVVEVLLLVSWCVSVFV